MWPDLQREQEAPSRMVLHGWEGVCLGIGMTGRILPSCTKERALMTIVRNEDGTLVQAS